MNINIITNVKHKQTLAVFPWILSFNFTLHDINYIWFCYANLQMHNSPSGNPAAPPPLHPATSRFLQSCIFREILELHEYENKNGLWFTYHPLHFQTYQIYWNLPNILKFSNRIKKTHSVCTIPHFTKLYRTNSRFSGSLDILKFQFVLFCMY